MAELAPTASGPLEAGPQVEWTWADGEREMVEVEEVTVPATLSSAGAIACIRGRGSSSTAPRTTDRTLVCITDHGWDHDESGLKSSYEHCAGWQHMVLCLKAWLVHGIELRD